MTAIATQRPLEVTNHSLAANSNISSPGNFSMPGYVNGVHDSPGNYTWQEIRFINKDHGRIKDLSLKLDFQDQGSMQTTGRFTHSHARIRVESKVKAGHTAFLMTRIVAEKRERHGDQSKCLQEIIKSFQLNHNQTKAFSIKLHVDEKPKDINVVEATQTGWVIPNGSVTKFKPDIKFTCPAETSASSEQNIGQSRIDSRIEGLWELNEDDKSVLTSIPQTVGALINHPSIAALLSSENKQNIERIEEIVFKPMSREVAALCPFSCKIITEMDYKKQLLIHVKPIDMKQSFEGNGDLVIHHLKDICYRGGIENEEKLSLIGERGHHVLETVNFRGRMRNDAGCSWSLKSIPQWIRNVVNGARYFWGYERP